MRNLLTIIILILILYSLFVQKNKFFPDRALKAENTQAVIDKKDANEKIVEEQSSFKYEPKNFTERIITNAVTEFIKTPSGSDMAKSLLTPKDMDLRANSMSFSTHGFNGITRKYQIKNIVNSPEKKSICGQKIKALYIIENLEKTPIKTETLEYVIGEHDINELNILADGSNLNSVVSCNFMSESNPQKSPIGKEYNKIHLTIQEHLSQNNLDFSKIKIFDEYVSTMMPLTCYDNAEYKYKISKINGEVLKTGYIKYTIGDYNYPIVLSYIFDKMPLIGSRTIILPQKYLDDGNKFFGLTSKQNEYIFFEIENVKLIERKHL